MSEHLDPYAIAWQTAEAANVAFDAVNSAETEPDRTAAMADFLLLQSMAAPAMLTHPSPFARSGSTAEEVSQQSNHQEILHQSVMDSSIRELMYDKGSDLVVPKTLVGMANILEREGVTTLRDVLTLGVYKVEGMRNFGDTSVKTLRKIIAKVDPSLTWHKEPSAVDVAQFCTRLDQIPTCKFDTTDSVVKEVDNLQALVEMDAETLTAILCRSALHENANGYFVVQKASKILAKARTFATDFLTARKDQA